MVTAVGDDAANDGAPVDPFTQLASAAAQMHELFRTYQSAGFTAEQSLYLVGVMLAASMRQAPPSG